MCPQERCQVSSSPSRQWIIRSRGMSWQWLEFQICLFLREGFSSPLADGSHSIKGTGSEPGLET